MTTSPDVPSTALAHLVERCGKNSQEAEALAAEMMQRQRAKGPGCTWGHIHPEQIAGLWNQAAKHGKRKLVLEITADAPCYEEWTGGHIQVTVKGAQTWADCGQEQQEARDREVMPGESDQHQGGEPVLDENGIFLEQNRGRYVLVYLGDISSDPFSFYDPKSQALLMLEDERECCLLIDEAVRRGFQTVSVKEALALNPPAPQ